MNPEIFRAYDIRGKYPIEINKEIVGKIISSFILKLKIQDLRLRVVIGHDARLSSPALYRAAIKRLTTNGRRPTAVIKIGLATTPMLYFLTNKLNADFGIMITASHSPKEYNGLKIVGKNAIPISGKEILKKIQNSIFDL